MKFRPAILALEDGTVFHGEAIGVPGETVGEAVFNTAMTGYQEILTDPSYAKQIVTLTYPHVGNVGTNETDMESRNVFAAGLVVRSASRSASNWRSEESLEDFLKRHNVIAVSGIDTRELTRILREKGAQNACLQADDINPERAVSRARDFSGLKGMDLAKQVSTSSIYEWQMGSEGWGGAAGVTHRSWHVVAYDFGVKHNILRLLTDRGCKVTVVPATTPAEAVLAMHPDGIFLSNGPGDPEPCVYAIEAIRAFLEARIPMFGICLGHQLLGLAVGAQSIKMKFGHHGANHPVQDLESGRVYITSQNHGFAVDEATLPSTVKMTHRSLFDGSLQGIACLNAPAFSFQGHPEASPGPHDLTPLFDRFAELLAQYSNH